MFVTNQPGSFARDLPSLEIEGIAVALIGGLVKLLGDVAVIVEITQLAVIGNVAPYEILTLSVPGRAFGPQTARYRRLMDVLPTLALKRLASITTISGSG
jgi:hypothetical protein